MLIQEATQQTDDPLDFVVANFSSLESEIIRCMEYIPYIDANQGIVSPKFAPILFEACSLIESIFRNMQRSAKKGTFRAYAACFEKQLELEEATTLFLVSPLRFLRPFKKWSTELPAWWAAYNKVKHNRIGNYASADFSSTVLALAGLHQVIARSWMFLGNLAKAGWFNEADEMIVELMAARASGSGPPSLPVETKLFVSPIRDSFVTYERDNPVVEHWEFSMRVKHHIWEHEGW